MDIRKVKKLIELLEESGVTEIEVCEGEESVRISRQTAVTAAQTVVQVPQQSAPQQQAIGSNNPGNTAAEIPVHETPEEDGHVIKAPMVGIFYVAPAPGEPAFVELGKSIAKGDVLCVIEAMKIMNQIESEQAGKITKIHVENGEPVEYGQALFTVK